MADERKHAAAEIRPNPVSGLSARRIQPHSLVLHSAADESDGSDEQTQRSELNSFSMAGMHECGRSTTFQLSPKATDFSPLSNPEERFLREELLLVKANGPSISKEDAEAEPKLSEPGYAITDNDAWMESMFPNDYQEIQSGFLFGIAPVRMPLVNHGECPSKIRRSAILYGEVANQRCHERSSRIITHSQPPRTIHTYANTTLFIPSAADYTPSDRDFLSRFSSMEGSIDERLANVSVYNNAPRTKSYSDLPSTRAPQTPKPQIKRSSRADYRSLLPSKRNALDAFEEDKLTSQRDGISEAPGRLLQQSPSPRLPVWPLHQTVSLSHAPSSMGLPKWQTEGDREVRSFQLGHQRAVPEGRDVRDELCYEQLLKAPSSQYHQSPLSISVKGGKLVSDPFSRSSARSKSAIQHGNRTGLFNLWPDISHAESTNASTSDDTEPPFVASMFSPAFFASQPAKAVTNIHTGPVRRSVEPSPHLSLQEQ